MSTMHVQHTWGAAASASRVGKCTRNIFAEQAEFEVGGTNKISPKSEMLKKAVDNQRPECSEQRCTGNPEDLAWSLCPQSKVTMESASTRR